MADTERLSPSALRRLNKTLQPLGLRVCRVHQGHPLPLTDKYFCRVRKCAMRYNTLCRACAAEYARMRKNERYHSDPEFRDRTMETNRLSRLRNREHRVAMRRAEYQRRKAERFAALLQADANARSAG